MTPNELRRTRAYTPPPMDYDDPYPGELPRPRVSPWLIFGCWLGVAAAFGTILGLTLP